VPSQRPGFKELEHKRGLWSYRDSYSGFYCAPGDEIVRLNEVPVWFMAYAGGMLPDLRRDASLAADTFAFLKTSLAQVKPNLPFRGPPHFSQNGFSYLFRATGDITGATALERIRCRNRDVFAYNIIVSLIASKEEVVVRR
jgi:hypothetical protein